ncbi:MAG: pentapeptide repeat-containing protein [Patescibacteria group bacterium]
MGTEESGEALVCEKMTEEEFFLALKQGRTNFNKVIFTTDIRVTNHEFSEDISFREAIFEKSANFICSQFHEFTHFDGAVFKSDASFHNTEFSGLVTFVEVTFRGVADFESTLFKGHVDLCDVMGNASWIFVYAWFRNSVTTSDPVLAQQLLLHKNGIFVSTSTARRMLGLSREDVQAMIDKSSPLGPGMQT